MKLPLRQSEIILVCPTFILNCYSLLGTPRNETNMNDINTHWMSLDRRYQSFRRTMRGRNRQQSRTPGSSEAQESPTAQSSSTETVPEVHSRIGTGNRSRTATAERQSTPSSGAETASPRVTPSATNVVDSPAVKFVTRPDFIEFLNNSGVCYTVTYC